MVSVLIDGAHRNLSAQAGAQLWLSADEVSELTGWELKPEGFCKDEICVPLPPGHEADYVNNDRVDLAALWALLGAPSAKTESGDVWCFGTSAASRNDEMRSLQAPDFTLPDFEGKPHSLSDFRRKRILLLTWASW